MTQLADIISRCIAAGADINFNFTEFTPLGEEEEIDESEYDEPYEDVPRNLTVLHVAARNNHTGAIAKLISLGARVDARTSWGTTPLMTAAFRGSTKVCVCILYSYMYVFRYGTMPLMTAAFRGSTKVCVCKHVYVYFIHTFTYLHTVLCL
jgi:hypothetical protein